MDNQQRRQNNIQAWKNLTGYQTTSGCPCLDRTMYCCIPKHSGWGYNPNLWCMLCCFLCETTEDEGSNGTTK